MRSKPVTELRRGDRIIVANTIKTVTSDPYIMCGYVYCEADNVLGLGHGKWNFRKDTSVNLAA